MQCPLDAREAWTLRLFGRSCASGSDCRRSEQQAEACAAGHQEFIQFLNAVERQVPADKQIHIVLDNDAVHKHAKIKAWLARHPRWAFHFTPTSCPWLNVVEGFFAKLTRRRLKHGVFHSLVDLQKAINTFIQIHNATPKPFVWRADPKAIIAAAKRGHQVLETIH